jgi:ABC-type multidrug transport system fused ATPase/permease subunit
VGTGRRLVDECRAFPGLAGAAAVAAVATSAAQLALPWLVRGWVEGPVLGGRSERLGPLLAWSTAALLALALSAFLSRTLLAELGSRLVEALRLRLAERALRATTASMRRFAPGDLVTRATTDAGAAGLALETLVRRLVGDVALALGAAATMLLLDWRATLLAALAVPAVGAAVGLVSRRVRRESREARERIGQLGAYVQEVVRGFTTVRMFAAEVEEEARAVTRSRACERAFVRAELASSLLVGAVFTAAGALILVLLWQAGAAAGGDAAAGARFVALALCAGQLVEPLRRLGDAQASLQASLAASERVYAALDALLPEPAGADGPLPRASVALEGVRFAHDAAAPVLRGVDLAVPAGTTMALVGPSGGGKSTLAALLPRLLEVDAGAVRVGHADVRDQPLGALRRAVHLVPQEPYVFRGSLLENVRYGSPGATDEAVRSAVRLAGLQDLAASREALLEAGRDLSGGQKQRIALARAILRDPAVLVLDEALNALDGDTEETLLAGLSGWLRLRTVVVITHRLSTARRAARVVLLDRGRVVEDASGAELDARPALGALFAAQWRARATEVRPA